MTFSIVARDPVTGAFGVATATGGPAVGSLVPHARAGVGAIATQSLTNPYLGYDGLDLLAEPDATAELVLSRLLEADSGRDLRQCLVIDREGRTAAWTGPDCTPGAKTLTARDVAVGGNMLASTAVIDAMAAAYAGAEGELEDRLLAALAAAHAAGGDYRDAKSAALKTYTTELYPAIDLRTDWSTTPIADLGRILEAIRAPDYADFFKRVPRRGS